MAILCWAAKNSLRGTVDIFDKGSGFRGESTGSWSVSLIHRFMYVSRLEAPTYKDGFSLLSPFNSVAEPNYLFLFRFRKVSVLALGTNPDPDPYLFTTVYIFAQNLAFLTLEASLWPRKLSHSICLFRLLSSHFISVLDLHSGSGTESGMRSGIGSAEAIS